MKLITILLINTDEDFSSVIYYPEWKVCSHYYFFFFSVKNKILKSYEINMSFKQFPHIRKKYKYKLVTLGSEHHNIT